jgi:hypothetical protein
LAGGSYFLRAEEEIPIQLGQSRIGRIITLNERSTSENPPFIPAPASMRDVQRYCSTCYEYHKVSVSRDFDVRTALALGSVENVHTQDDRVCVEKRDSSGAWLILENLPIVSGKAIAVSVWII